MAPITGLKFFEDRIQLAGPDGFQINRGRSNDRTTQVIKKWLAESEALRTARSETMQTLEALPGKDDSVRLVVMDRPKFDSLQEAIKAHAGQITALEEVIRALDAMGGLWFNEQEDKAAYLGRSEGVENRQITAMSAGYLQKKANSGLTPEKILDADPEFQRLKNLCEARIKVSKEQYAIEKPKLEAMRAVLESVGC